MILVKLSLILDYLTYHETLGSNNPLFIVWYVYIILKLEKTTQNTK